MLALLLAPSASADKIVVDSTRCLPNGPPAQDTCDSRLWTMNGDGTGLRSITEPPLYLAEPAWSPDGQWIVATRVHSSADGVTSKRLWVLRADGSEPRPVGPGYRGQPSPEDPSWSPSGDRIVFTTRTYSQFPERSGGDIYSIRADGTDLRPVAGGPAVEFGVSFTPDGRLLFSRGTFDSLGVRESKLVSARVDGSDQRDVSIGDLAVNTDGRQGLREKARFSPDASRLAVLTGGVLRVVSKDEAQPPLRDHGVTEMTWSPDGSQLLYSRFLADLHRLQISPPIDRPLPGLPQGASFGAGTPDWWTSPVSKPRDRRPPSIVLTAAGTGVRASGASTRRRLTTRRGALRLFAADQAGLRRVEVALGRRGRRAKCRFLGRRSLGPTTRCSRPRYRRVRSAVAWRRWARRIGPGRWTVFVRASDRRSNRTRRARRFEVRVTR